MMRQMCITPLALLLALLGFSDGFSFPSALPALRTGFATSSLKCPSKSGRARRFVSPIASSPSDDDKPLISFNPNEDWKADHQRAADADKDFGMRSEKGNVDTPDFFEDAEGNVIGRDVKQDLDTMSTGDSGSKAALKDLLTPKGDVIEFKRQTYTKTLTRMGGFHAHAWKIDGTFTSGDPTFALKYNSVAPTTSEICIEPNAMTFEDFLAGWTDDSAPGWVVTPEKGTLDRRGGDDTYFQIEYKGEQPETPLEGTLVILLPNDNFSWTFKFQVRPPGT